VRPAAALLGAGRQHHLGSMRAAYAANEPRTHPPRLRAQRRSQHLGHLLVAQLFHPHRWSRDARRALVTASGSADPTSAGARGRQPGWYLAAVRLAGPPPCAGFHPLNARRPTKTASSATALRRETSADERVRPTCDRLSPGCDPADQQRRFLALQRQSNELGQRFACPAPASILRISDCENRRSLLAALATDTLRHPWLQLTLQQPPDWPVAIASGHRDQRRSPNDALPCTVERSTALWVLEIVRVTLPEPRRQQRQSLSTTYTFQLAEPLYPCPS